jgi:hypothetical protein
MVTIAEVAERLKIPASTAREYVKRFRPFFPTKKVAGSRFPKYPDMAFEVMRDIVEGYKKELSTDDLFDLLQQKYPLDAELLDRQQQQTQNIPNPHDDTMITAPTTSQTSLDFYTKMQVAQFQVLQQMTQVLENNNKLMERLVNLLEKQQLPKNQPTTKSPQKRSKTTTQQAQKPQQPRKKGWLGFLKGK